MHTNVLPWVQYTQYIYRVFPRQAWEACSNKLCWSAIQRFLHFVGIQKLVAQVLWVTGQLLDMHENKIVHVSHQCMHTTYRMAGNNGGESILVDWRFWEQSANISIRQTFYSMMSSLRDVITSSICHPPSFKMSAWKLQTSKEWNKNSPDFVYHQLVPASYDVLWFEMDRAVFTLLTIPLLKSHYLLHNIKNMSSVHVLHGFQPIHIRMIVVGQV